MIRKPAYEKKGKVKRSRLPYISVDKAIRVLYESGGSKIFTNYELAALLRRIEGDKSDPDGIYSHMVQPKLLELHLVWQSKDIFRLLQDYKRKKRVK